MDASLFAEVGEAFGVSGSVARDLYYEYTNEKEEIDARVQSLVDEYHRGRPLSGNFVEFPGNTSASD